MSAGLCTGYLRGVKSAALNQVLRELGQRVREARLAAGLTQETAAARANIDYKRYQKLELGAANPTVKTLVRVAEALETDFWALLGAEPATRV